MSFRKEKHQFTVLEERDIEEISEKVSLIRQGQTLTFHNVKKRLVNLKNLKLIVLVAFAIFTTTIFTMVDETHEVEELIAITADHNYAKDLEFHTGVSQLELSYSHLPPNDTLEVHVQGWNTSFGGSWVNLAVFTYYSDTILPVKLRLDTEKLHIPDYYKQFQLYFVTNSTEPVGMSYEIMVMSYLARYEVYFAGALLLLLYVLIVFELMHRTVAAMVISFLSLGVLSQFHYRPTFETVVSWINYETIGLLFGMMIMIGIFSTTGFFEWAAVKAFKITKGNLWNLTVLLCCFTAIVSAFLDNVTTIILVAPVTITLCKVLNVNPVNIVIAEVIASNVGGTSTIIGDPPNIILLSDKNIKPHIDFATFTLHIGPPVIISMFALILFLWKFYKDTIARDPSVNLEAELSVWKKTLLKLQRDFNNEDGEQEVLNHLESYIMKLEGQIQQHSNPLLSISELEQKHRIKNWELLIKSVAVIFIVIIMFFMHSLVGLDLSLAWIAIIGAMIHILISGITEIEEILEKVELGTLMFFAALFILMKTLEELGLIQLLADAMVSLISGVPEGKTRLLVAILLLLWISAFTSAFIDNIPYTVTLTPVVVELASSDLGLPLRPLVWALSLGTCLGGNGTIIGASANVVGVGLCEREGFPVTFLGFMKIGMPIMVLTVFIATVYLCIFNVLIEWD